MFSNIFIVINPFSGQNNNKNDQACEAYHSILHGIHTMDINMMHLMGTSPPSRGLMWNEAHENASHAWKHLEINKMTGS